MNRNPIITSVFALVMSLNCSAAASTSSGISDLQFLDENASDSIMGVAVIDSRLQLRRRLKKLKSKEAVIDSRYQVRRQLKKKKSKGTENGMVIDERQSSQSTAATEDRMLYCGIRNGCDAFDGNSAIANKNEPNAVRCCTEDPSAGWPDRCANPKPSPLVYGQSKVPQCQGAATFTEAVEWCAAHPGGRLCTGDELLGRCTGGTGCQFNHRLVWGCTANEGTCSADAECCGGYCGEGGVCEVAPVCIANNGACDADAECCGGVCSEGGVCAVAPTLTSQIICGYQGWFTFPGDGAPVNRWKHWFNNPADPSAPTVDEIGIEMLPTTDEYDDEDLFQTGILKNDGTNATFYSAAKPRVVLKHFEWMETYGITGVFHMRFMESLHIDNNRNWKTIVLQNVKSAAEATGRAFAVSYNIAGKTLDDDVLDDLKADWIKIVDEEHITESDRYIRQDGKPVLRIFGIGFKSVNVDDTVKMAELIDWFQNTADEKYRVFLVGGVPSSWRERINDSKEAPEWEGIYDSLDGIHPWHVGRWTSIGNFDNYFNSKISPDVEHCRQKGILYMPTMWPGFSWHNLKGKSRPVNQIPRLGGDFMWRQAYKYAADSNINTIWMAQFDEVDEATAIMKVAPTDDGNPVDGNFLALDADGQSLPSDWYLRLCGEAQKMLEGNIALSSNIPIQP